MSDTPRVCFEDSAAGATRWAIAETPSNRAATHTLVSSVVPSPSDGSYPLDGLQATHG